MFVALIAIVLSSVLYFNASPQASTSGRGSRSTNYSQKQIEHGKYLVTVAGCNDCHTPKKMMPAGPPVLDESRLLSGHISVDKIPSIPQGVIAPDKWGALTNNNLTAWAGPWGVSFAKNLTPDNATGLGSWTEDMFIKAMRTGKDMGQGRQILPPMPWQDFAQMTDQDLKDVFGYLRSLKPVSNAVPDPIPPSTTSR